MGNILVLAFKVLGCCQKAEQKVDQNGKYDIKFIAKKAVRLFTITLEY